MITKYVAPSKEIFYLWKMVLEYRHIFTHMHASRVNRLVRLNCYRNFHTE